MKIAQISAVFPPYKGGIGQVAYEYSRGLCALGEQVEVFTLNYGILEQHEFPCHFLSAWPRWGKAGFAPQILFKLDSFDIVQLHYPAFGLAEAVAFWKFLNKKKKLVIFYHHDVVGKGFLKYFFWLYQRLILPWLIELADVILVSSMDYALHSDLRYFIKENQQKFIALPFGVSDEFTPGTRVKEKNILFVGGLDRNHYFKGVNVLLGACKKLENKDWQLTIIGDGDLRPILEEKAHQLGIKDKVIFVGRVSDAEKLNYYQRAYVCCLPSIDKSEAFGLVLIEAMACGVPVIASDLPGVRSVVSDEVGWKVRPNDEDALATQLDFVLAHPEIQVEYGKRAAMVISQSYRWKKIITLLLEIYKV